MRRRAGLTREQLKQLVSATKTTLWKTPWVEQRQRITSELIRKYVARLPKNTLPAIRNAVSDLGNYNPEIRFKAISSLKKMSDYGLHVPQAVKPLILLLKDSSPAVRKISAFQLGYMKARRAVPQLAFSLKDKDPKVRAAAVWALGRMKVVEAAKPIMNLLGDRNPLVRTKAADALGEMKVQAASKPLDTIANNDPDKGVRKAASKAVTEILLGENR